MSTTAPATTPAPLRFEKLADVLAEMDRLVAAERDGRLFTTGQWELGQCLNHLSVWVKYSFEGAPVKPNFVVRLVAKLVKNRVLNKGMPRGMKMPGVKGGTLGYELMPTPAGVEQMRTWFAKLDRECPTVPNPLFGMMTHEQWKKLHLRHAELHFGFYQVK
jgi:hypothetical protein